MQNDPLQEQFWLHILAVHAIHPTAIAICDLVRADLLLHKRLSPVVAEALIKRTEEAKTKTREGDRASALDTLIRAWILTGDFPAAWQLTNQIPAGSSKNHAVEHIVVAQARAGQLTEVLERINTVADPIWKSDLLYALVKALAKYGTAPRVLQVIDALAKASDRFFALVILAESQVHRKQLAEARKIVALAERLREQEDSTDALLQFARLQITLENKDGARRSLRCAEKLAKKEPVWALRQGYLQRIVVALLKLGDRAKAKELALSLSPKGGMQETSLRLVGVALAKSGDLVGARQLFIIAARGLATATDGPVRARCFAALAGAQREVGELQGARKSFSCALHAARALPDAQKRAETLGEIAELQAESRDFAGARNTLQTITNPDVKARSLNNIVVALAEQRNIRGAMSLARSLLSPDLCARAFLRIALTQARQGDIVGCQQTSTEAFRFGAKERDIALRAFFFGELISMQSSVSDLVGARANLALAMDKVGCETDPLWRAAQSVAVAQALKKDLKGALATAQMIPEMGRRGATLCDCLLAALDPEWNPLGEAMCRYG